MALLELYLHMGTIYGQLTIMHIWEKHTIEDKDFFHRKNNDKFCALLEVHSVISVVA